ncbi:major tail protein [Tissierella creatinophila]|uniref:Phage major tail protein n=1 Tax=Tissierella creatinophila DSM 6911 TaxID=1123403 RepID=A0A1U7M6D4_TISCR|nr:major tail protein [Tissierella creatinophila]OLS02882.1 phage major tail protein [Tissierella creatinophila DSM 6911]
MTVKKKLVIKNIRKLYYAILKSETENTVTYDPIKYLPGLREITVTPEENSGEIYAEGMVWDSDTQLGKVSVTLDATDLSIEQYAELLGKELDKNGGVIDNAYDESPYIALMYEKEMTQGVMEYATLFKGKLSIPEDKVKTREGNVEYQTKSMQGTFMPLNNGNWRNIVRSDSPDFIEESFMENWGEGKTIKLPEKLVIIP